MIFFTSFPSGQTLQVTVQSTFLPKTDSSRLKYANSQKERNSYSNHPFLFVRLLYGVS